MKRNKLEVILGLVLIIVVIGCIFYAIGQIGLVSNNDKIMLIAKFDKANGIQKGSEVKISGITVGEVTSMTLEKNTFRALVMLNVDNKIKIPMDSVAAIGTNGLLGNRYIEILPGQDDTILHDKGEIMFTKNAIDIESLVNKFILNKNEH